MSKTFNTPLLLLLFTVITFGVLTSCDKNDNADSGKVELLSFGPTGAKHGDTLRFIGNHLDQVTSIELTGTSRFNLVFETKSPDGVFSVTKP